MHIGFCHCVIGKIIHPNRYKKYVLAEIKGIKYRLPHDDIIRFFALVLKSLFHPSRFRA